MATFEQAIPAEKLREEIIKPTLIALGLYNQAAENLLFGTCAHESHCGKYVRQVGGPALGIYQMEPATYKDLWTNFLKYKLDLASHLLEVCGYRLQDAIPPAEDLVTNVKLSTAMCRIHYLRVKAPLPAADDLAGLANYWKKYYNTALGKGTVKQFIQDYERFNI